MPDLEQLATDMNSAFGTTAGQVGESAEGPACAWDDGRGMTRGWQTKMGVSTAGAGGTSIDMSITTANKDQVTSLDPYTLG